MVRLRIGIIGTGRKKARPDLNGFAMAYVHASAYAAFPELCELVACADIVPENGMAFARQVGIPDSGVYTDYRTMLAEARLDMVSICTWPHLHAPMTLDCAAAGVRAIYCEKPIADSWGAAVQMVEECERRGVQLTFHFQRRFGKPFLGARDLLRSGAIGDLVRLEMSCTDLFDYGIHYLDLCGMYAGEVPAQWVMGQIDCRTGQRIFGALVENESFASWRYENGVYGLAITGPDTGLIGVHNRLVGTSGVIEVGVPDGPPLRLRRSGSANWETIDTNGESIHGPGFYERAMKDTLDALLTGREPELHARRALRATEIVFAIYESSRRRARVDLPLTIQDHPLLSMVQTGDLSPASAP